MADYKFNPTLPLFKECFAKFKELSPVVDIEDELQEFLHMALIESGMVEAIEKRAVAAYLAAHPPQGAAAVPAEHKPSGGKRINCWQLYVQEEMPKLAKDPAH